MRTGKDTVPKPRLFLATEIDVGRGVHKKSQAAVFTAKIIFRSHFQEFSTCLSLVAADLEFIDSLSESPELRRRPAPRHKNLLAPIRDWHVLNPPYQVARNTMDDSSNPGSRNCRKLWARGAQICGAANAFAPDEYFSYQTTSTYYEESYEDQEDTRAIFQAKKKNRPPPKSRPTTSDQAHHYNPGGLHGQNAGYYGLQQASPPGQSNAQYQDPGGQAAQTPPASYFPPNSSTQAPYTPPLHGTATYNTYQQGYGGHQSPTSPYGGSQAPVNSSPLQGSPNSQHSLASYHSNTQQQLCGRDSHQNSFSSTCVSLVYLSPSI